MTTAKIAACAALVVLCGCATQQAGNQLAEEKISGIRAGQTRDEVRGLLGSPSKVLEFSNLQREVWDYPYSSGPRRMVLSVQFSRDGIAREVLNMTDPADQINNYGKH